MGALTFLLFFYLVLYVLCIQFWKFFSLAQRWNTNFTLCWIMIIKMVNSSHLFFLIVYLNTLNHKSHCELTWSLSWMIYPLPSVLDASWKIIVICHQVTSRYLSHCWPSSMSPFGINELKGLFPDPNGGKATDNFCNISWWKHLYSPEISVEY